MENAAASLEYFVACLDASKWACRVFYDNKEQIFCNKGGQEAGLPDFSWYKIPKLEEIYQITANCTKCR
jgi:hypothetical protein